MKPLELMEKELKEYERSLEKSLESFSKGDIGRDVHQQHIENLGSLIQQYKHAIYLLKREKRP